MEVLERTLEQRMSALHKGNEVRVYRAARKRDVKAGRAPWDYFLAQGPHDRRLQSMRLREALLCMPAIGPMKVDLILKRAGVSPSKTLGGVSGAQWERLYLVLESYPSIRKRLRAER